MYVDVYNREMLHEVSLICVSFSKTKSVTLQTFSCMTQLSDFFLYSKYRIKYAQTTLIIIIIIIIIILIIIIIYCLYSATNIQ